MKLLQKTIAVSGAGSGIGRELTLQLIQKGARVAGIDLNSNSLEETKKLADATNDQMQNFTVNIADRQKVKALPDQVLARFGHVDGLINNAGIIQPFKRAMELTDEEIERVVDVNFFGTMNMTRAFLPHLLTRPEAHLVNISSMGGFLPVPGQTIYGAAKAGVKLFTEGLHSELADTNVNVTVIFPGAIETNITDNSNVPVPGKGANDTEFKQLPASEAAKQILVAIEKKKYRATIGLDACMLDLLYRLNPRFAAELIQKQMKSLLK